MTADRRLAWTTQQDELLRRELDAGKSAGSAAAEINAKFSTHYTRSSIIGRAWRIGVQLRVPPSQPPARKRKRAVTVSRSPSITLAPTPGECAVQPVPLLQLERHHCRAPLDVRDASGLAMFCGAQTLPGQSYCAAHCERFFQPPTRLYKQATPQD